MASTMTGGYYFVGILLIILTGICTAKDCSYRTSAGQYLYLSCPGFLDDDDDTECCGLADDQYCCSPDEVGTVASGLIIGISMAVGIIFFGIVATIIVCVRMATCPLYRGNRPGVTSTVMTRTSVAAAYPQHGIVPLPNFQNPLAAPVMVQNPPSYNQSVGPVFTPLPEVNMSQGTVVGTGDQQMSMK